MLRISRFLYAFSRFPLRSIESQEIAWEGSDRRYEATLIRPRGAPPLPGWVVLHGLTTPGRHHPGLVRFAHSLAATGATVLLPGIPAWSTLRIDPTSGHAAIREAIAHLRERPDALVPCNVVGFSFGATQALVSSARPEVAEQLDSVVSFGGYCSLRRTVRFMMTGHHEWEGTERWIEPDPYGRWIVAANYLDSVPGIGEGDAIADAARELAAEAGRRRVFSGDPIYDSLKADLRRRFLGESREIWDLLAPPSGVRAPVDEARELGDRLVAAGMRVEPGSEPVRLLEGVKARVVLAHGRADRLIPFTEALRLRETLHDSTDVTLNITRLFAHSAEADPLRPWSYPREIFRYAGLLNRALQPGST